MHAAAQDCRGIRGAVSRLSDASRIPPGCIAFSGLDPVVLPPAKILAALRADSAALRADTAAVGRECARAHQRLAGASPPPRRGDEETLGRGADVMERITG